MKRLIAAATATSLKASARDVQLFGAFVVNVTRTRRLPQGPNASNKCPDSEAERISLRNRELNERGRRHRDSKQKRGYAGWLLSRTCRSSGTDVVIFRLRIDRDHSRVVYFPVPGLMSFNEVQHQYDKSARGGPQPNGIYTKPIFAAETQNPHYARLSGLKQNLKDGKYGVKTE